ncbi:hypothetical protein QFC21_007354 [Naganishia friedmannii]|uniref:Uncharacterized protein n=1 Tax=Naganishia friedmannii TaxID=89922 RepID=A0ACC2UV61_9TREE|nr:hypothetical protein QFC21_007354 [Naganishia friedmannii]
MRIFIVYQAAVLLAFAGTALADTIFIESVRKIGSNATRDCYPRAWVRAEDLRPGREVRAEARLKVEGDGCDKVVSKWQVGLRKRERAIFKFHAANVTLPERPQFKPDADDELPYHDESASTYLRPFRVNIPPTNFPYTASTRMGRISYNGAQDISSVEELFEYYFLLTYNDGTVVDVPAGVTAFVPASTAEQYEHVDTLPSVVRPVHLNVPRAGDRPSAAPKETPECDDGLVSDFKVSVELPHDGILAAGTTYSLNVTIEQLGNSTEVPAEVFVRVKPCKRDTWAATYAFDEQHKAQATTCDDGFTPLPGVIQFRSSSFGMGDAREGSVLMTKPAQSYGESHGVGPAMRYSMMGHPRDHGSVEVVDDFKRTRTLQVNLTIPDDIAFTYNHTLQSVENRLYVRMQTQFSCEKTKPPPIGGARAELIDDDLWTTWWTAHSKASPHNKARKQRIVTGNVTVEILPPITSLWNASSPLIDYKDPAAKAIVLSTIDASVLQDGEYPHVNTLVIESEQDRQLHKFDIYQRLPICKHYKHHGRCQSGLGEGLTGEVWARYQWRQAQSVGGEEEEKVSPLSSTVENEFFSAQVVLH